MPPGNASSGDTELCKRRSPGTGTAVLALGAIAVAGLAGTASAETGGATYVPRPQVKKVRCIRRCASGGRARAGASTLKIVGANLRSARKVVFHGGRGRGDDVAARVRPGSNRRLHVRVPVDAVSGPLSVRVSRRVRSRRSRAVRILPAPPPVPNATLSPTRGPRQRGAPRIETGTSRTRYFYGARGGVRFTYRLRDDAPARVTIELVRARDGATVKRWSPGPVPSGRVRSVVWRGTLRGRVARSGRYSFRLAAIGRGGAVARSSAVGDVRRDAFNQYGHLFPIRGRHDYGGGGAEFGSGRGGRSHQGHDVFARCGTKLVAARGGRVQYSGYHRAAGYYLVIDGSRTGVDYAYMHLQRPSPFAAGDRVYTGQRIGSVGETGNARGCHLHFELWGAPGWYQGGRPFDPEPSLRRWDRYS